MEQCHASVLLAGMTQFDERSLKPRGKRSWHDMHGLSGIRVNYIITQEQASITVSILEFSRIVNWNKQPQYDCQW